MLNRLVSLLLVVVGIGLLYLGYDAQQSIKTEMASLIDHQEQYEWLFLVGAGAFNVVVGVLRLLGNK